MRLRDVALCVLAAVTYADEAEIAARTKWAEARVALEKKDGETALKKYSEALEGLPADPMLLYEAAWCAFDEGGLDQAEKWIDLVVRTEDADFKRRPEYQDAFALVAKVRAGREIAAETAKYAKPLDLMEEAIRRVRSKESMIAFLSRTFVEIHMPKTSNRRPLKEELAQPRVFSGWTLSDGVQPHGSCRLVLQGIATESGANAVFDRLLEIVKKELPTWERLASKLKDMDPRIIEDEDDTVRWDSERVEPSLRRRSVAYVMKTNAKEEDLFTPDEIKLVAISIYVEPKETFRVVLRVQAGFP